MSDTPKKEKRAVGRPSKYKPEYCEKLIAHMADGYTFDTFMPEVSNDTLFEWLKLHPEFAEAKKAALKHSKKWWLSMGRAGMGGKIKGFNATVWIFCMKNMHGWRDVQEIHEHSTQTLEILIDDTRTENYAL